MDNVDSNCNKIASMIDTFSEREVKNQGHNFSKWNKGGASNFFKEGVSNSDEGKSDFHGTSDPGDSHKGCHDSKGKNFPKSGEKGNTKSWNKKDSKTEPPKIGGEPKLCWLCQSPSHKK